MALFLLSESTVVVIGVFKDVDGKEAKAFLEAAESVEDVKFGITTSSEVFTELDVKKDSSVVILKKFDDGRSYIEEEITKDSVISFVSSNSLPLIVDFNSGKGSIKK